MPKNIVIFSDGTGRAGEINFDEAWTNVYKLFCRLLLVGSYMRRLEAKIGLSDSQCTRGVVCTADELLAGDSQDRIFDRGASVAGERYRFSPHPPNFPCVLQ